MINKKQWVAIGVVLVLLIVFFVIRKVMMKSSGIESGYNGQGRRRRNPNCETNYIFDKLKCDKGYEMAQGTVNAYAAYKKCLRKSENKKNRCLSRN